MGPTISSHLGCLSIIVSPPKIVMDYRREIYYLVTLLVCASFLRILQGVDCLYSVYLRRCTSVDPKKRRSLRHSTSFILNHFLYLPIVGNWSGLQFLWQTIVLILNLVLISLGQSDSSQIARRAGTFSLANYLFLLTSPRSRLLRGVFGLPPAAYRSFHFTIAITSTVLSLLHLFLLLAERGIPVVSRVHAVTVSFPFLTTAKWDSNMQRL